MSFDPDIFSIMFFVRRGLKWIDVSD